VDRLTSRDRRPLPRQVRDEILALIARDGLRPGDRLPTEMELATRFGVGRTTAREALKLLEQDGIVDVRPGRGRYLSHLATLERPITRLESVTELMRSLGYGVTDRVVSVEARRPGPDEAAALSLSATDEVVCLDRMRMHADEALIYSVDVFPRRLIAGDPAAEDWTASLFERLEAGGLRVTGALAQIQAVLLPAGARRLVGGGARSPWILLVHRNLDEDGRTVVHSTTTTAATGSRST
jgi:GntR family transcriptional regulator